MSLSREFMLERMNASDRTYNGHFLTGVLSTGIYCLPSCTARKPKAENVRFFLTEQEAQAAGLRACRRCRPDDFYRDHDPDLQMLLALTTQLRAEPGAFPGVESLVSASGLGATKLHALFRQRYHTTPANFLNQARVAAACRLLAEPPAALTILDTAYTVGFESLSAFNENFRKLTGLCPSAYRRLGTSPQFTLTLPPNYRPEYVLRRFGRDPESPLEGAEGKQFAKGIRVGERVALLRVEFCGEQAGCQIEAPFALSAEEMRAAHATTVRLLGLASDPTPFERRLAEQDDLARLIGMRAGLRIPLLADLYEGLVWAIVGQQMSLTFAGSLRRRLAELCGESVGNGFLAHPTPEQVARLDVSDLTQRQFSRRKAETLLDTSRAIASGDLPLESFRELPPSQVEKRLLAIKGLGVWSAQYILLRACGFADCVPVGDSGLRAGLRAFFGLQEAPDATHVLALMEPFAPYRSLATYHLWTMLGESQ